MPTFCPNIEKEYGIKAIWLETVADVANALIALFTLELKNKRYNQAFISAVAHLFTPDCTFHSQRNKPFQISEEELRKARMSEKWRQDLKPGDEVDVYVDVRTAYNCESWMKGKISKILNETCLIDLPYLPIEYDQTIDQYSTKIAQPGTRSGADAQWKQELLAKEDIDGSEIDCHDNTAWRKSTIFAKKTEERGDRQIEMVLIGLRVYRDPEKLSKYLVKQDERGSYEGFSSTQDIWVPLYAPQVALFESKTGKVRKIEVEDTEGNDDAFQPKEGQTRVYVVPRQFKCTSSKYMDFMNFFGNLGYFDHVLEMLETAEVTEELTFRMLVDFALIVAKPSVTYHRQFVADYGQRMVDAIRKRLEGVKPAQMREINQKLVTDIFTAYGAMLKRIATKEQATQETESFKLALCVKLMQSELLEARINGIRTFNDILEKNRSYNMNKTLSVTFLIDWITENKVLDVILDPKRTHQQLVERSDEVYMFLLREKKATDEILLKWWNLQTSYKREVLKIISDNSYYLEQDQKTFYFEQVIKLPVAQLDTLDFELLSKLSGGSSNDKDLQDKLAMFFWRNITESKTLSSELVDRCANQFAQMSQFWDLAQKKPFFEKIPEQLNQTENSILPVLDFFTKFISMEKDRYAVEIEGESFTLQGILQALDKDQNIIEKMLGNLGQYFEIVKAKVQQDPAIAQTDPKKISLINSKDSHIRELEARLNFLVMYATSASLRLNKDHLKQIYGMASASPIKNDVLIFFQWLQSASRSAKRQSGGLLDMDEVGNFLFESIDNNSFNFKTLPVEGFDFLGQFWFSVNEAKGFIANPQKIQSSITTNDDEFEAGSKKTRTGRIQEEVDNPPFVILATPDTMEKSQIIWDIVLQSEVPDVVNKATIFLASMFNGEDSHVPEIKSQSKALKQQFISKCFELLKGENISAFLVKRIVSILTITMQMSEKNGTGGVQPHNSILKGELIDRITIKNKTQDQGHHCVVQTFSSATVWEFRRFVSHQIGLSPRYCQLELPGERKITNSQNALTIEQLGLKTGDVVTARRIQAKEQVGRANMIDPKTKQFIPEAHAIFDEWFDHFKDHEKDALTKETTKRFIYEVTGEILSLSDDRVEKLFKANAKKDKDLLQREEFIEFYRVAADNAAGGNAVYENMENMLFRSDMKRYTDMVVDDADRKEEMPRHLISANEEHFNTLMALLNRNDETTTDVWNLVRSLATNESLYKQVVSLSGSKDAVGMIDWQQFFNSGSTYKQIYVQEIIEELMESGQADLKQRVMFVEYQERSVAGVGKLVPYPRGPLNKKQSQGQVEELNQELDIERRAWAKTFLENGGFDYIIDEFQKLKISQKSENAVSDYFELKKISFLSVLIRVILTASFSTDGSKNIGEAISIVRKSSLPVEADSQLEQPELIKKLSASKGMVEPTLLRRKSSLGADLTLEELMQKKFGAEVLASIDFKLLCKHLITTVSQVLQRDTYSIDEKVIVENTLALWTGCVLHDAKLFEEFINWKNPNEDSSIKDTKDFLLAGLLFCPVEKIRIDFHNTFSALSSHQDIGETGALKFLLKILAHNFNLIAKNSARQYFDLLNSLIALKSDNIMLDSEQIFDPTNLMRQVIDKINEISESKSDEAEDDENEQQTQKALENEKTLVGLIELQTKILQDVDEQTCAKMVDEFDLVKQIFEKNLFASYFQNQQHLKGEIKLVQKKGPNKKGNSGSVVNQNKSKEAAFKLLESLLSKSGSVMQRFMSEQLGPMLKDVNSPSKWNFVPAGRSTDNQLYVGIRNLGCICYMNSMLQQFFMVPCFRYNMLCVDDKVPDNLVTFKGSQVDDNMLHQLQKLFAHLELSNRQAYDPTGYCFSFKEFDGTPTKTMEQKDAQEFLSIIFDRVDTALAKTNRKYLLDSIFGGGQVSQMVCPECGKIKNRHESFLTLSLPVRDCKSVEDALKKNLAGETISDFRCDGCNKKVELSKRTLISATPNVLILHLMRIEFNFNTENLDKINSLFKFPHQLDLKPYSYHETMKREGRPTVKEEEEEPNEKLTEEELAKKKELEDEFRHPEEDDCYEYKLVGVNVHSGTAQAGHYWSYINTNRGTDEEENDPTWMQTENDPWMEFNDAHVTDYKFNKLDEDVSGDASIKLSSGYDPYGYSSTSSWGGSYGKSAYMLFYERRKKKDLKFVVKEEQVEEEKAKGVEVTFDEEKKEYTKLVNYRKGVDATEKPNEIYRQVFQDNSNYQFENDIYGPTFVSFVTNLLKGAAGLGDDQDQTKLEALKIGQRAGFEMLARLKDNEFMREIGQAMIDILRSSETLCQTFITGLVDDKLQQEVILDILIEGTDKLAQRHISRVIKYAICRVKMLERDDILNATMEPHKEVIDGTEYDVDRPKSVALRFLDMILSQLKLRAPKSYWKFDYFLELISTFGLHSPEELADSPVTDGLAFDKNGEAYRIGMTCFYQRDMLQTLGDFILQKESPLYKTGELRETMGNAYRKPNFSSLIKVISTMMQDQKMIELYPLSEISKQIISSKAMLKMLMDPENDLDGSLAQMAKGNLKISKKIAKAQLSTIAGHESDKLEQIWKSIKSFLKIKDEFQQYRLEWIFGIADLSKSLRPEPGSFGVDNIKLIEDKVYNFKSMLHPDHKCLLGRLVDIKEHSHTIVLYSIREILDLCVDDDVIFNYLYNMAPYSYKDARFFDWITPYCDERAEYCQKATYQSAFIEKQANIILGIREIMQKFQDKCAASAAEEEVGFKAREGNFLGIDETWMAYSHQDVIKHWTPQYIVGRVQEPLQKIVEQKTENVNVFLQELKCEWMYGNPTGAFNLSLPDVGKSAQRSWTPDYYHKIKMQEAIEAGVEPQIETKNWREQKSSGPVMLQLVLDHDPIEGQKFMQTKVNVTLRVADNEKKNVNFPIGPVNGTVKNNHILIAQCFQKIDPSKDGWGDITMEVISKEAGTKRTQSVTPGSINVSSVGIGIGTMGSVNIGSNLNSFYGLSSSYGVAVNMVNNDPDDNFEEAMDREDDREGNDEMAESIAARMGGRVEERAGDDNWSNGNNGEYNEGDWDQGEFGP